MSSRHVAGATATTCGGSAQATFNPTNPSNAEPNPNTARSTARMLGRPLEDDEVVHHINGDKLDNEPENLELWSTSHPKDQRVNDKVAFAIVMLRRYRPELLLDDIE
jgi:hypothetical protein